VKRSAIVLVWLVFVCARAHAQDVVKTPDNELKIPMTIWATGVVADQITTYRFASGYRDVLRESNPLISGLDRHPALLVAAGSAIDAATGWAAYRLFGANHPRLAKVLFYSAAAYRGYLAASNLQKMRQAGNR